MVLVDFRNHIVDADALGRGWALRLDVDDDDDFLAAGRIPVALIRWEMTGLDDEVAKFWDSPPL